MMKAFGKYITIGIFLIILLTTVGTMAGCGDSCSICGVYVNKENPRLYIEFRDDGTYYMPVIVGVLQGHWYADGNMITVTSQLGSDTGEIVGDQFIDRSGGIWIKSGSYKGQQTTSKVVVTPMPTFIGGHTVSSQSATIIGKWRHGLPETCPPNMDPSLYQKTKAMNLPENELYYLEFLKNGTILHIDSDGQIMDGTYKFISDNYVEINWNMFVGTLGWELFGGHGVYELHISGNKMTLKGGQGLDTSYWRSD